MKKCPTCQTTYSDDSLQFCLQDGARLADAAAQSSADYFDAESPTVVSPKKVEPIRFDLPSAYHTDQTNQPNQTNQTYQEPLQPVVIEQREVKKSNTATVVTLSVLGTVLLLGLGGLGAYLYSRGGKNEVVAVNVNAAAPNRPANANSPANQNQNANAATPTPAPTAQPTLKPEQAKAVTDDVKGVMDDWKYSTENGDIDTHISQYADTVDYYKAGRVGVARVRADRARAFAAYDSISINLDNVKVTPDASGEKATVVLDKEWNFEGTEKFSSGKVQQQLTLNKVGGKWRITGEKDLKIYYTQN